MTLTAAIASAKDGSVTTHRAVASAVGASYVEPVIVIKVGDTIWARSYKELAALRAQYPQKFEAEKE